MPTPRPDNMGVLRRRIEETESGCHVWLGAKSIRGYGTVVLDRRSVRVHRLVYELTRGPIAVGHDVHHECGNRLCVNPDHLVAISHAAHSRLHAAGASKNVNQCLNGHPFDDENTYTTRRGIRQCRVCNRERKRAAYWRARGLSPCLEVN